MGNIRRTPMPMLRILDLLSDPGNAARRNEDTAGGNTSCAFVIDGATGLGGKPLLDATSDAAWLATFATQVFEAEVGLANPIADVVRNLNARVRQRIVEASAGETIEAWALPTASFQLVRMENQELAVYGLGDCRLFLSGADGTAIETNEDYSKAESEGARRAVAQAGGLTAWRSLAEEPVVREALRRSRARHNQPGGSVWTLGSAPEAAAHLSIRKFSPALPARGLLCTDGFSALADKYARYDSARLIQAASERGLATLMSELRRIEREEDPDGQQYPRFKVSDDATALLFEITD
ncbi:hypothetical protein [Mesorhizobium sp. 1M-11]|uniref:hypothetical protein n=1 Tax=Mesorhizobium sp. 1M-11 TaxID=1529006 RepID=UPI001FCCF8FE|nr:hypothetical protein [Mesorhizobium sp. 1M-11]